MYHPLNASLDPDNPENASFRQGVEDFQAIFELSEAEIDFAFEDQMRSQAEIDLIRGQSLFQAAVRTFHLKILTDGDDRYEFNLADPEIAQMIADEDSVLYRLVREVNPEYVSAHLSASVEKREYGKKGRPYEVPVEGYEDLSRDELLRRFSRNIATMQMNLIKAGYKKPLLVESLDYHPTGAYEYITELGFIEELLERVRRFLVDWDCSVTQVRLLVDVCHIILAERNRNVDNPAYDYKEEIKRYLARVIELVDEVHLVVAEYAGRGELSLDKHLPFYTDNEAAIDIREVLSYVFSLRREQGIYKPLVVNFETDIDGALREVSALAEFLEDWEACSRECAEPVRIEEVEPAL